MDVLTSDEYHGVPKRRLRLTEPWSPRFAKAHALAVQRVRHPSSRSLLGSKTP